MEKEILEMRTMMETIVNTQLKRVSDRFTMLGMRVLVSDKKFTLVRDKSIITELVSAMGIHAALSEISFDFSETITEIGEDNPEIAKLQRKLMAVGLLARIGEHYASIIRDKQDEEKPINMFDKKTRTEVVEKMREGSMELLKESPADRLAEQVAVLAKDIANKAAEG